MTSQCGPQRPNLNETKMRRRTDVACRVGMAYEMVSDHLQLIDLDPRLLLIQGTRMSS